MKHPSKPFAVEIKRSRRSPMPSSPSHSDFLGRTGNEPDESLAPAVFSKRAPFSKADAVAKSSPDQKFAVPAFLRSEKPAQRTAAESFSKEAEQVFAPKPTQSFVDRQASEGRAQPRILPSLIVPEGLAPEADSIRADDDERPARGQRAQQNRKRKNATPITQTQARAGRVKENATATRRSAKPAAVAAPADSPKRKPRAGAQSSPTPKSTAAVAISNVAVVDAIAVAAPDPGSRGTRIRSATRRGRGDVVSLPPGQHWKRRLNPRAW